MIIPVIRNTKSRRYRDTYHASPHCERLQKLEATVYHLDGAKAEGMTPCSLCWSPVGYYVPEEK